MNSVTVADITEGVKLSENILHLADELSEFNVQLNLDFEADDAQEVFYHAQQLVSRKAKYLLGTIKNLSASSLSTIPLVGTKTKEILSKANLAVEKIQIDGGAATTVLHWQTVSKQMMLVDSLRKLESDVPDHEEEFGVFVPTVVRTFLPFLRACLAVARARSDAKLRSLVSTLSGVNDKEAGRRVLEGGLFDRKRKLVESKIMEQVRL
ncbi:hypothetical protein TL16_g09274 [Triparma laevis f. inornata]|uniref:Uncharacterized protein n=1 Tax=Triparma laevis f. inornata TaxID=1714386 RepID=A0A9W7B5L0_9STRA|nr:hypothetical protein TL16_g09274 [Triparma laevis f. inornata]